MTPSAGSNSLREEAQQLLARDGYTRVPPPFAVGRIDFDLEGLYTGPTGTLSLALVHQGPSGREESGKLYWRVQRLVRALDAEGSRLSVTVVLIGGQPDDRLVSDLQTIARVLLVDGTMPTERMLAPLMRLSTPGTTQSFSSGLSHLASFTERRDSTGLEALIAAVPGGPRAVEAAYKFWLDQGLERKA